MTNYGEWKLSSISPALVVSSGLVFLGNRKPKGLYLEDVLEMIKAEPGERYYAKQQVRRVTLREAVAHNELDELGKERIYYSAIDLVLLRPDRDFGELPRTGKQLLARHYKSEPRRVE